MSWVWRGATLDSTEITPLPPRERRGTIWSSLPEYKSTLPSDRLIRVAMAEKLPLASFTTHNIIHVPAQGRNSLRLNGDACPARYIIEDNGNLYSVRNSRKMGP